MNQFSITTELVIILVSARKNKKFRISGGFFLPDQRSADSIAGPEGPSRRYTAHCQSFVGKTLPGVEQARQDHLTGINGDFS